MPKIIKEIYNTEKLFCLGKTKDKKKFYLEPDKLTRHAIVVGATGSGKTVICKNIVEQAVLNNIPIVIIDPKGDIGTLAIASKTLNFRPWSDTEAEAKETPPEKYEEILKQKYEKEYKEWDITADIIEKYIKKLDIFIYTPKSNAGLPISISPNFEPPENFENKYNEDPYIFNEIIESISLSLLKLVGFQEGKCQRECAFLSQLILHQWKRGKTISIRDMISLIDNPPFHIIGSLSISKFLPDKDRLNLLSKINLILTMPSLSYWLKGERINFDEFYKNKADKTKVSIIDLRWITSDNEKYFFLEMFLKELYNWLIKQSGTEKLRYLFYFDEIKGYYPSEPRNPPSKKFLEILVRQGRAFGFGCLFATQNPGDIDYKAVSNIGIRFIGNLKTERDMKKISEGMDISTEELQKLLVNLNVGDFIFNDASSNKKEEIHAKWLISYHRGPLQASEIQDLMSSVKKKFEGVSDKKINYDYSITDQYADSSKILSKILNVIKSKFKIKILNEEIIYEPWLKLKIKTYRHEYADKNIFVPNAEYTFFYNLSDHDIKKLEFSPENLIFNEKPLENSKKLEIKPDINKVIEDGLTSAVNQSKGLYFYSNVDEESFFDKSKDELILKINSLIEEKIEKEKSIIEKKYSKKIEGLRQKKSDLEYDIEEAGIDARGYEASETKREKGRFKIKKYTEKLQNIEGELKKETEALKKMQDESEKRIKKEMKYDLSEFNFEPNENNFEITAERLWMPQLTYVIKLDDTDKEVKIIIKNNKIVSLGKCEVCKADIPDLNQPFICDKCGSTFCSLHSKKCIYCKTKKKTKIQTSKIRKAKHTKTKTCKICKSKNEYDATFCVECGKKLK